MPCLRVLAARATGEVTQRAQMGRHRDHQREDLGFGIWDLGSGIWDLGSGIWCSPSSLGGSDREIADS